MNAKSIENKARELQSRTGGTIFAFPINESDPLSKYVVVTLFNGEFVLFPGSLVIEEAANGIKAIMDTLRAEGHQVEYDRDVRFVSYEAQMNGPNLTIRRLKKQDELRKPLLVDSDAMKRDDGEEGYFLSARGVIKYSYLAMVDDSTPKAFEFMDEYYKLLAMRKYGKTAAAIKREVQKMDKDEAVRWIEGTYAKFIHDDMEVMDIFNRLKHA